MTWTDVEPAALPLAAARRWSRIAAVCTLVVIAAVASALFVGTRGATRYGGRADVVYLAPASASLDSRERGLATQRALVASRAVLDSVAAAQHVSRRSLERSLSVGIGARDDLMEITVTDPDKARAVALAGAVADTYLRLAATLKPPGTDPQAEPRLLSRAYALDAPVSPKPLRLFAAGLLAGIAVAAVTGVALARRP